jgi:hypothetical protein
MSLYIRGVDFASARTSTLELDVDDDANRYFHSNKNVKRPQYEVVLLGYHSQEGPASQAKFRFDKI